MRTGGIDDLLEQHPGVRILADAGYRGLRRDHKRQVVVPPPGPRGNTPSSPAAAEIHARARTRQSAARITVEHAIGRHKQWRGLRRWHHHRHTLPDTYQAVTGLVSDRDATR